MQKVYITFTIKSEAISFGVCIFYKIYIRFLLTLVRSETLILRSIIYKIKVITKKEIDKLIKLGYVQSRSYKSKGPKISKVQKALQSDYITLSLNIVKATKL